MYCARCGEIIPARAVVCRRCGADLTRAGAIRMTSGALAGHDGPDVTGLGLPADIFTRHRRDEALPTNVIPAVNDEPETAPSSDDGLAHETATATPTTVARPRSARREDDGMTRHRWFALGLVVVMVIASMALVIYLAVRLMNPLSPIDPGPSSASTSPTPSASSTPRASAPVSQPAPTTASPTMSPPSSTSPPALPQGVKECAPTVGAQGNASCPFALAVDRATRGRTGSYQVSVLSPASNRAYNLRCAPDQGLTRCTAGNAIIWLRR